MPSTASATRSPRISRALRARSSAAFPACERRDSRTHPPRARTLRMDQIFTAGRSADAVPIWFVTGKTYTELRERLDEGARAFADAAGFEPKAGRHLLLPARSGLGGVLFGLEDPDDARNDPFLPGRLPQILPDGVYRFANEAPRPAACGARFRARVLPLHPLPQARRARAQARSAAEPRSRRTRAHRRSGHACARPHQHAGQRHGAAGARSRGRRARCTPRREDRARSSARICWPQIFR